MSENNENGLDFNTANDNLHDLNKADTQNRLTALNLQSFIVEAPAGAGKTELLTQRYLKLLSVVEAPEEIIALTFTNKAAAEMRNRILQSLLDAEQKTPIDQPHKQQTRQLANKALAHADNLGWQLLTQPSRLRILTMDALCSSLARQMPLLSRLGGQPRISDDPAQHYLEAAKRTLADVAKETSLDAPISACLSFMHNDIDKLAELLSSMLAKREQWLPVIATPLSIEAISAQCAQVIHALVVEKLQAALQGLPASTQKILMPTVRFAASNLEDNHAYKTLQDWNYALEAKAEDLPNWLVLTEFLIKKDGEFRATTGLNKTVGFPLNHPDKVAHQQTFAHVTEHIGDPAALNALRKLPAINATEMGENSVIVQAFSHLLTLAAAHLWHVFQAAGEVDFIAIAHSAIRALSDEDGATDLALKLDYKISHLLVDEFQDTNPTQMALITELTQSWQQNDSRTLFCVGDPMQSIYRFRKADVSLFLQASTRGIGQIKLQALKLHRNNRSHPNIVGWINEKFNAIFPENDDAINAAIAYRPFIATKESCVDEGAELHPIVVNSEEESASTNAYEARYVADLIEKEQLKNPTQSIAVLVRSRSHLRELVTEIRRNFTHITFQAVEIEALQARQTVQDALSLTRAMLHKADRVHWLNMLRAPWCGLSLADLHALCAHNHHATIWQLMQDCTLSADGMLRLSHVKTILNQSFNQQARLPLRRWCESTWLQLGGGNTLVNAADNRDVQAFFDLVEKLAQGHSLDFIQLETAMKRLYAEPDVTDSRLQFLTIHKSKGLEFDCVILPALNRKPRHDDSPLMLWEEVPVNGQLQLLAAPKTNSLKTKAHKNESPSIYSYIKAIEATRAQHETARLLYVAATRTVRKLHLIATVKRKNDEIKPVKNSLLELLWPSVTATFTATVITHLPNENRQNIAQFTPQLMRLKNPQLPAALAQYWQKPTSISAQNKPKNVLNNTEAPQNLAADKGILAHIYLEIIANTDCLQWPAIRINACATAMCKWLQQRGYDEKIAQQTTAEVIALLQTTIASKDGQWVLTKHAQAQSELALQAIENDEISTKVIDRTFIANGNRWVIDYKTMAIENSQDVAAIEGIAMQFKPQLAGYALLFAHEDLPIKQAIFFLSIGQLVVL